MRRRLAALVAAVTVSLGSVTACSGDDYCARLKDYAAEFEGKDFTSSAVKADLRQAAEKVAKSAPAELQDDWKAVFAYDDALRGAGGDSAKLRDVLKQDGGKASAASRTIEEQAEGTCHVKLPNT
ncbi:hypothetical protein OG474_44755 [Kribbella sp. NBC_01505]|uniref:hypothetical protein n=1 Tax=Kribbella sp. NBC_01505 TaxID=2903580 RepID=UPI00386D87ED